jgi:hypothetical protein
MKMRWLCFTGVGQQQIWVAIWQQHAVSEANTDLDQPRRRRFLELQRDRDGSSFQWADDSCQRRQIATSNINLPIEATLFPGVNLASHHAVTQSGKPVGLVKGMFAPAAARLVLTYPEVSSSYMAKEPALGARCAGQISIRTAGRCPKRGTKYRTIRCAGIHPKCGCPICIGSCLPRQFTPPLRHLERKSHMTEGCLLPK